MTAEVERGYTIRDPASKRQLFACPGPTPGGACGRVPMGDAVGCAGMVLTPRDAPVSDPFYMVPTQMTLCPITLLQSLAVPADSTLLPRR